MRVAVLYPNLTGSYRQIFDNIIEGIQKTPGVTVLSQAVPNNPDPNAVGAWLARERADAVIALGQRGYELAKKLPTARPIVVGAALFSPNGVSGISLAANPAQFFQRLGTLTPPVERVFVVYSERNSGWLIPLAVQAAERYGIELVALPAEDMRGAVRHYHNILQEVRDLRDAIWLPLDNVAPDKTILPLVLEAAWKKRLVVFSNNPSHVQKGALFSLFPDHHAMGRRLAEMALQRIGSEDFSPGVVPLDELKVAVNLRTASHLGMLYAPGVRRSFALVFPSR
jgi:putative ABC transport system substrate-binding protein